LTGDYLAGDKSGDQAEHDPTDDGHKAPPVSYTFTRLTNRHFYAQPLLHASRLLYKRRSLICAAISSAKHFVPCRLHPGRPRMLPYALPLAIYPSWFQSDVEWVSADKRLGALEASHWTLVVDATLLLPGGW
jgi:hypothetical protein